jgi:hypothetical protein
MGNRMPFDPTAYGPEVARILALNLNGERLVPLAIQGCSSPDARRRLAKTSATELFPASAHPEAALAGLWLYFSCYDEAHSVAQDLASAEGSFWHAILHRQEPDAGNSAYWFRRVGKHAAFPQIRDFASGLGYRCGPDWDPFAFIEYCEKAHRAPGSDAERLALEIQRAEWQILFHYCAVPVQ